MEKTFEALEFIKEKFAYLEHNCENFNSPKEELDVLKQALLKAQEQEKVLEVVYNKKVAMDLLLNPEVKDYIKYNSHCDKYDFIKPLDKEEFELLKNWVFNNG